VALVWAIDLAESRHLLFWRFWAEQARPAAVGCYRSARHRRRTPAPRDHRLSRVESLMPAWSLRDVELLPAERGVVVSYGTVRRWPRPGVTWHLELAFIRLQGVQHYLWRAADLDGIVLDILVHPRRDSNAAKRFFK
jgi:hypothetical protein